VNAVVNIGSHVMRGIFDPLLDYQGKLCSVVFIRGRTWVER
jgi:hypothetical protein